jgi:hypothetical protein
MMILNRHRLGGENMKSINNLNNLCHREIDNIELSIPANQPKIFKVINVYSKVYIQCHKIIKSISGKKLIINAIRYFKIFYTSEKNDKNIYCKTFKVPLCIFLPYDGEIKFVKVDTEYTKLLSCNSKTINLCMISLVQVGNNSL